MSYATIEDLRANLGGTKAPAEQSAYAQKMLHKIPKADVVDRVGLLVDLCRGKKVLEFGASGPAHEKIQEVASQYLGVDREAAEGVVAYDLDDTTRGALPITDADVIVCGEVLEHLSNPGYFLSRLSSQYPGVPVAITVPNAFSSAGRAHLQKSVENVNVDHVSWYSYRTLRTLLERHGYRMESFCWYHGKPLTAEGLIVLAETSDGAQ